MWKAGAQSYDDYYARRFLIYTLHAFLAAFALVVAVSRVFDYQHFWIDVVAGSLIGLSVVPLTYYFDVKPCREFLKRAEDEKELEIE